MIPGVSLEAHPPKADAALTREPSAADPYDQRSRVAFADALRTFAILAVVCDHVVRRITTSDRVIKMADVVGILGVDCFFVLTGFLLSRPYLESIMGLRPFPSTKMFYARRFFRIWPLYAVAVVASAFGERLHGGHHVDIGNVLAHLTLTHNFFPTYYMGKFNIPLWTMAISADFYLLLPPVAFVGLMLARKLRPDRRLALVLTACAVYLFGSAAFRISFVFAFPGLVSDEDGAFTYLRNVIGLGGSLSVGILIAACGTARMKISAALAYGALVTGALAAGTLFVVTLTSGSLDEGAAHTPLLQATFDHIGALAAGGILLAGLYGAIPFASTFPHARWIVFLSAMSYAIYLFHDPILNVVFNALDGRRQLLHPSWKYVFELTLGTVGATLLVSYVAHRLEQPFLRRKDALRERPA